MGVPVPPALLRAHATTPSCHWAWHDGICIATRLPRRHGRALQGFRPACCARVTAVGALPIPNACLWYILHAIGTRTMGMGAPTIWCRQWRHQIDAVAVGVRFAIRIVPVSEACRMFHTHALGMVVVGAPPVRPVQGGAIYSTSAEPIATHSPPVPFRFACCYP